MFFRHQKMDDDLEIHPEWEPYVPNPKVLFSQEEHDRHLGEVVKYSCPFLGFFM